MFQTVTSSPVRPRGVVLLGVFFALAACILTGVELALLSPESVIGTPRALLMPFHVWLGPDLPTLAAFMFLAGVGCILQRSWGWWLAVSISVVNGLSDTSLIILGHYAKGAIGVTIAGLILLYLFRPGVRISFH